MEKHFESREKINYILNSAMGASKDCRIVTIFNDTDPMKKGVMLTKI